MSKDTPAPSTISLIPEDGFTVETTGLSESDVLHQAKLEIAPVQVGGAVMAPQITDGSAAVISNTATHVDTVLRPAYDGLMAFQAIRDNTAPETYSWEVTLGEGESLKLLDEQHAGIFWEDGTQALLIGAQSAHGADGKAVTTSLTVTEGNIITLTVHHRISGVVYPVVAGVGWQGGFKTHVASIEEPPPAEEEGGIYSDGVMGAPVPYPMEEADKEGEAGASGARSKYLQTFRFRQCSLDGVPYYACGDWEQAMKGFFWYNYHKAWYPARRDPRCPPEGSPGISVEYHVCEWVGKHYAWYETAGEHITAQVLYKVSYLFKGTVDENRHMSVYAYPSGYANEHDTDCICNPST